MVGSLPGAAGALGDAKVHHPGAPFRIDHHIAGLEVTVHHTRRVRRHQGAQHINHQGHGLGRCLGTLTAEHLGQRFAFHILEHQVGLLVLHISLKHRHDVGVVQAAHAARLSQPLAQGRGVRALHRFHHLDRHFALQPRVKPEPDFGLRPLPEQAPEFKTAQLGRCSVRLGGGHTLQGG